MESLSRWGLRLGTRAGRSLGTWRLCGGVRGTPIAGGSKAENSRRSRRHPDQSVPSAFVLRFASCVLRRALDCFVARRMALWAGELGTVTYYRRLEAIFVLRCRVF